jgi:hypothetical protein
MVGEKVVEIRNTPCNCVGCEAGLESYGLIVGSCTWTANLPVSQNYNTEFDMSCMTMLAS